MKTYTVKRAKDLNPGDVLQDASLVVSLHAGIELKCTDGTQKKVFWNPDTIVTVKNPD